MVMTGSKSRPVVEVFRALASEARVGIVRELSGAGEKCVCELVASSGLGWSTVSHHLSVLKRAGIVKDRRRGQQVFYRLSLPCVTQFIRCLESPKSLPELQVAVCCR
jgi:DNA-binding transcriptional ArsR family regulator